MIAESLAKFLRGNPAIGAVTQSIEPMRLYADHAEPAVVYYIGEDLTERTLNGSSSLMRSSCSINCYSSSYEATQSLAEVVFSELHNYAGAFGDVTAERIDAISRDDAYESETKYHSVQLDFEIWYTLP